MPDIQHLIELLKSDNPNKRYDACEELRVSRQSLPQEAIDALKFATSDSTPDVADAARRALALHTPQLTPEVVDEKDKAITKTLLDTKGRDLVIGFFGWFLVGNLYAWLSFSDFNSPLIFGFPLVTIIVMGVLLYMKRNWFAYGIVAAVITNILILEFFAIGSSIEGYLVVLQVGVLLPIPFGFMIFMS